MKRSVVADGIYKCEKGNFWIRPWLNKGQRSWRKLKALRQSEAIKEGRSVLSAHSAQRAQGQRSPLDRKNIGNLIDTFLQADCPNNRLEPAQNERHVRDQSANARAIKKFFGSEPVDGLSMSKLVEFANWRKPQVSGLGNRTIDKEIQTLSNVLNYAAASGFISHNPIKHGRPRFTREKDVKHCRDHAPTDADKLHLVAERLLNNAAGRSTGFMLLFAAFTGCRTGELLALRTDAKNPGQPGFISGNYLFIQRLKNGVNPFALIHPALEELIEVHKKWCPGPWYFPGLDGSHIAKWSLGQALKRASESLNIEPHITPHGLRSFYVTKRRSDGVSDAQIAAEIGDKSVDLIHKTYGDRPPNWTGDAELSWVPKDHPPAWAALADSLK